MKRPDLFPEDDLNWTPDNTDTKEEEQKYVIVEDTEREDIIIWLMTCTINI